MVIVFEFGTEDLEIDTVPPADSLSGARRGDDEAHLALEELGCQVVDGGGVPEPSTEKEDLICSLDAGYVCGDEVLLKLLARTNHFLRRILGVRYSVPIRNEERYPDNIGDRAIPVVATERVFQGIEPRDNDLQQLSCLLGYVLLDFESGEEVRLKCRESGGDDGSRCVSVLSETIECSRLGSSERALGG